MSDPLINFLREANVMVAIEGGPRLSTRYHVWIDARDRAAKRVLLGGLGCLGCGQMWVDETALHATLPGFDDAPEQAAR